jgi:oxalate---CoA ligase
MSTLSAAVVPSSSPALIIPPSLTLSYSDLTNQIHSFQTQLAQLGIKHGDAVSISLPNSLEFIVSFLAIASQRAICAPLNPAYTESEFDFYISDLKSTLVLVPPGAVESNDTSVRAARKHNTAIAEVSLINNHVTLTLKHGTLTNTTPLATPIPDDIALVLHTSGTTGRPKAVPLTHRNLTTNMRNIVNTYCLTPSDRTLLVMPLFHIHGLQASLLSPLLSGGSIIVHGKFSASTFWNDFVEHKANWYSAVPTMHNILLKRPFPDPMPRIRFIRSCSSALPAKTLAELEKRAGCEVLEAYAMTEASHQMCANPPGRRKPGTVGVGQGVKIKIMVEGKEVPRGERGEICVTGKNVTLGYLNNEKANKNSFWDGWFRTGDEGVMDGEGYVTLTGRLKEMIIRGGDNISPVEVDGVVASCPGVVECVSFGVPDETLGEVVGAAVMGKVEERGVVDWVKERIAKHKVPTRVSTLLPGIRC